MTTLIKEEKWQKSNVIVGFIDSGDDRGILQTVIIQNFIKILVEPHNLSLLNI